MTAAARHQFLWLDLETTGLVPNDGRILEFAAVLCADASGDDLAVVEQYSGAIHWPAAELAGLQRDGYVDDYVYRMHIANELWADVETSDASLADAEGFLVELADDLLGAKPGARAPAKLRLAGNSVGQFDLQWIRKWMPDFAKRLSHQCFDVSTLSAAASTWGPGIDIGEPAHRALPDVLRSIEIARRFRAAAGWAK